jgi:hypothetical protein
MSGSYVQKDRVQTNTHEPQTRDEHKHKAATQLCEHARMTHVHCTRRDRWGSIGPWLNSVPWRVRERGDDALDLQVLVHGCQPLVPAEAAHLVPAEGRVRVEGEVAVHPHGARAHRPGHPIGDVQALGHDPGGEPVPGAVGLLDHLINRPGDAWRKKKCANNGRQSSETQNARGMNQYQFRC